MKKTGIVRHPSYLEHIPEEGHVESPRRLEALHAMVEGWEGNENLTDIPPRQALREEILQVHDPDYLRRLASTRNGPFFHLTPDTHASPGSYGAAMLAAGGLMEAVTKVTEGEVRNGFAMLRPPGHHAERSRAMGFCLFNHVAIAAAFARQVLGLRRVLVVDWDVHHGNGTQHAFENDPSVLFFSIHQGSGFPGTGLFTEAGRGKGEGYTINIPLPGGYGDEEYLAILKTVLHPVALEFGPELILVSAGFDAHRSDPLGKMKLTASGFAALARHLMQLAQACCGGRLALALEGGYHLEALRESVKAVLQELTGPGDGNSVQHESRPHRKKVEYAVQRCAHVHRRSWKMLDPRWKMA